MNVLVLHGPTLQALGHRPGDATGFTLADLDRRLSERARALGHVLRTVQSNHEGALADALWEQRGWAEGVVLNPGPLALGSHVLRAAVAASTMPVVEVLLLPAKGRAAAQRRSVLRDVCAAHVAGSGAEAYLEALERLGRARNRAEAARTTKTLGRGPEPRTRAGKPTAAAGDAMRAAARTAPSSTAAPAPSAAARAPARATDSAPAAASSARGKTLGPSRGAELGAGRTRTGGASGTDTAAPPAKSLGRATPAPPPGTRRPGAGLTRAEVRARIADRLAGRLSPAGLATWARGEWVALQRGAAVEAGQRDQLEDVLQALFLAVQPRGALSDTQLVEWMAALE